jgi:hypothetical protein
VEVLIALGIISVVLGFGAVVFSEVARLRGAQDRYNRRLASVDFLLRRIARDVRTGEEFLAGAEASGSGRRKAEKFAAGAATMIVSIGEETVIYRASAGKLERIEIRRGGIERGVVLDAPGVRVSFKLEGASAASARSVVTTAEWSEPPSIGVSRPTLSLRVALRNSNGTASEP